MRTQFKNAIVIVAIIVTIASLFGCVSRNNDDFVSMNDDFKLSDAQVKTLTIKARSTKDADAESKLFWHYELGVDDSIKAFYWLTALAESGSVEAQYNLGITYAFDDVVKDKELARYWLTKASKNGVKKADEVLKKIDE